MSNKETLQEYNNKLIQNNEDLQTVIDMINNLPEAGEGGNTSDDIILYKELEYIETEKTYGQYLVTNHKITNKTRIRAKFSRDLSVAGGSLFGVFTDAGPTSMFGYQSNDTHRNRIECYWGEPTQTLLIGDSSQLIHTTDFVVDVNRNNWAVYDFNGQALGSVTFSDSEFETEYTTPILAARVRTDIVNQYGYAKLYYCQIYEDDVLIYDLVPAIDSDERVCMYNKVDGTFLYNAGTGSFVHGPVVAVVKENINTELDDYNAKLTAQEISLVDITNALKNKAAGATTIIDAKVYSTEETVVGKWINNKPLYRKTFVQPFTVASGAVTITPITHGIGNIENIWVGNESYYLDASGNSYAMNYCDVVSTSTGKRIRTVPNVQKINLAVSSGIFVDGGGNANITVYYTKSTDVATTEDLGTVNYSLEEREVGTDVDGSIIYEKTINATPAYSSNGGNKTVNISYGVEDATNIRIVDGFWYGQGTNSSNRDFYPLNFINTLGNLNRQFSRVSIINKAIQFVAGDWITVGSKLQLYAKIRYNKKTAEV